jgi:3-isopropylmalate/(R)-2-methylmalate dehydratase small subunit
LIAPSFADILYNNCFKNGILPIVLDEATVDRFFEEVANHEGYSAEINLEQQTIRKPNGETVHFEIDAFRRKCLLEGLDDIELTLKHEAKIRAYEAQLSPFQMVQLR